MLLIPSISWSKVVTKVHPVSLAILAVDFYRDCIQHGLVILHGMCTLIALIITFCLRPPYPDAARAAPDVIPWIVLLRATII